VTVTDLKIQALPQSMLRRLIAAPMCLAFAAAAVGAVSADLKPWSSRQSGPAKNGLALAAYTESPRVDLGQPIQLTIEIRNVSSHDVYIMGGDAGINYSFGVVDTSSGKMLPQLEVPRGGGGIYGLNMRVGPRQAWFLTFRLDDYVPIEKPGTYLVTVSMRDVRRSEDQSYVGLTSNAMTLHVTQ